MRQYFDIVSGIIIVKFLPDSHDTVCFADQDDPDQDELDSEEEYMFSMQQPNPNIDTMRVEEIPAKEPVFNAVPKKSALKKKPSSNPGTPTQDTMNRPLIVRQDNNSSMK